MPTQLPNLSNLYRHPSINEPFRPSLPNTINPWTKTTAESLLKGGQPTQLKSPTPPANLPMLQPSRPSTSSGAGAGIVSGIGGALLQERLVNPLGDYLGQKLGDAIENSGVDPDWSKRRRERRERSKRDSTTPTPTASGTLGAPPFKGGQGVGVTYNIILVLGGDKGTQYAPFGNYGTTSTTNDRGFGDTNVTGKITGINSIETTQSGSIFISYVTINGTRMPVQYDNPGTTKPTSISIYKIKRSDNQADTSGDPPNQGSNPNGAGNFMPSREIYFNGGQGKLTPPVVRKPELIPTIPSIPTPAPDNRTEKEKALDGLSGKDPLPKSPTNTTNTQGSPVPSATPNTGIPPTLIAPTLIAPNLISPTQIAPNSPTYRTPTEVSKIDRPPTVETKLDPKAPPKPNIPPAPQPQPQPKPDTEKIQDNLTQNLVTLSLLIGAIPNNLANNAPFKESVKQASKAGTCETAAPNGCVDDAIKRNTDTIGNKVDAAQVSNNAQLGIIGTALAALSTLVQSLFAFVRSAFNNTIVDKAIGVLNLMASVHNAAMLTTSIKDTLFEAISQGLATIGIKSPEGSPIDINQAVNSSVENLLKGILGADQYTGLKESWQKANRVIQSGAAIVNTARSLYDSNKSLNELTGNNVGRIGNALKRDGVVSENAYKAMSENNNQVNSKMERLQNLEEGVSTLASITSEAYSIRENVEQLTKDRDDFNKKIAELPPREQIENLVVKATENTQKAVSQSPIIPLTELYKPDI